jgi:hypothetical protein
MQVKINLISLRAAYNSNICLLLQEINETMEDYVSLPCRQFSNIVKRYIQHRKAIELKGKQKRNSFLLLSLFIVRVQNETFDNKTQSVMEKMGSYYEQVRLTKQIFILFFLFI